MGLLAGFFFLLLIVTSGINFESWAGEINFSLISQLEIWPLTDLKKFVVI